MKNDFLADEIVLGLGFRLVLIILARIGRLLESESLVVLHGVLLEKNTALLFERKCLKYRHQIQAMQPSASKRPGRFIFCW
uniref:Uncharacterized protein n=1 Tax=Dechloromonas aromatica (strain RCB) TaxID=159087 RepID=Q47CK3_DECAR